MVLKIFDEVLYPTLEHHVNLQYTRFFYERTFIPNLDKFKIKVPRLRDLGHSATSVIVRF